MLDRTRRFLCWTVVAALPALAANVPGIRNFDQVDPQVYRGGQPTSEGFLYLARIGVKTVIDLREAGDRAEEERRIVTKDGMVYLNVPMTGLTAPSQAELLKILPVLEDGQGSPVFVHCWRGADRTGAVIAAYRIDHNHWDNARALMDAKAHGMSFFQLPRQDFIRHFQAPAIAEKKAGESGSQPTTVTASAVAIGQ